MKKEFQQTNRRYKEELYGNFRTKNTIIKIGNTKDWLNRIQGTEERISELEDRIIEITSLKKCREIQELWDHLKKKSIIHLTVIIRVEKEDGTEKLLEEIMATNFPKLAKYINLQIQKAEQRKPHLNKPKENHTNTY